jgi:hypothetical protein
MQVLKHACPRRKEKEVSNNLEYGYQHPEAVTLEESWGLQVEVEASRQLIVGLSDKQSEEVTGGLLTEIASGIKGTYKFNREINVGPVKSAVNAITSGPIVGYQAAAKGMNGSQGVFNHLMASYTI